MGTDPYKSISESEKDPLPAAEQELQSFKLFPLKGIPAFTGGGVGYVSYDCVRHFEPKVKIPSKNPLVYGSPRHMISQILRLRFRLNET